MFEALHAMAPFLNVRKRQSIQGQSLEELLAGGVQEITGECYDLECLADSLFKTPDGLLIMEWEYWCQRCACNAIIT